MENDNINRDPSDTPYACAAPDDVSKPAKKKKGIYFGEIVIGLVIAGVLMFMLLPPFQQVRGPHRRTQCLNNLRQISLALINYESTNGHFPPAYIADENGKPMHSWRVLLLPYLEGKELYDRYRMDEPWDGPNNSKLHGEMAPFYRCGSSKSDQHYPNYVLITGKGTAFDSDQTISYGDLTDGSSNTIIVTEAADAGFHWMKPQDIALDEFVARTREGSVTNHPEEINIALFDGSTHCIGLDIPAQAMRKLVMIADGEVVNVLDW